MAVKPKSDLEKVVARVEHTMTPQSLQDPEHQGTQAKPLRHRLNPLRLQKVPDVPQERIASKEHGASLLSRIVFLWVTPFIKVSNQLLPKGGRRKLTMQCPGRLPT